MSIQFTAIDSPILQQLIVQVLIDPQKGVARFSDCCCLKITAEIWQQILNGQSAFQDEWESWEEIQYALEVEVKEAEEHAMTVCAAAKIEPLLASKVRKALAAHAAIVTAYYAVQVATDHEFLAFQNMIKFAEYANKVGRSGDGIDIDAYWYVSIGEWNEIMKRDDLSLIEAWDSLRIPGQEPNLTTVSQAQKTIPPMLTCEPIIFEGELDLPF
jgi:hypothetical protein